jgi:hypothetical protein
VSNENKPHPSPEVQHLIVQLADALCTWERNTLQCSVLIVRAEGGVCYRALDGKPGIPDYVEDADLLAAMEPTP